MDLLEIIGVIKKMKAKRIAVVYIPNRLDSISSAEKIFSKIVSELEDSGLEIKHSNKVLTLFDNATKVEKVPFGKAMIGMRITHMYIDNNVLELEGGERFVNEALMPCVIPSGSYANLDATEEVKERVFIFDLKGNTEKYF